MAHLSLQKRTTLAKPNQKEKHKVFKNAFNFLSRIGKALMFPIAVLPIAAILMRIGAQIPVNGAEITNAPVFVAFVQKLLAAVGATVFDNLHMLFAIGVAFGLTKDNRGEAAITGFVGMVLLTLLMSSNGADLPNQIYQGINFSPIQGGENLTGFHRIFVGKYDQILATNVLNGIIMGIIVAFIYNRFNDLELPKILGFFNGRRLVPVLVILSTLIFTLVWAIIFPWIGWALYQFSGALSQATGNRWAAASISGIYVFLNRLLIPFGLHHVPNTLFWFVLGEHPSTTGGVVNGDINIFLNGIAAGNTAGVFQSGFFPMMMFGLPAMVGAFYYNAANKDQAKRVISLFLPAALVAFMTGITEPIEFAFMFISPLLYLLHALLSGFFSFVVGAFGIQIGFGFSAGFLDYLLSIPKSMEIIAANKTGAAAIFGNPAWIFVIGLVAATTYFFVGNLMIKKFNLATPGRRINQIQADTDVTQETKEQSENALSPKLKKIILALGGWSNISSFQNCVTRLRYDIVEMQKVNFDLLKSNSLVLGIKQIQEKQVQIIIGPQAEIINNKILAHKDCELD